VRPWASAAGFWTIRRCPAAGTVRRSAWGNDVDKVEAGRLLIDLDAHQAIIGGEPLDLTRKELLLLIVLARNANRIIPLQVLLEDVWGPGQSPLTLRYHVAQLRRKLSSYDGAPQIGMKRGLGYYLSIDHLNS
jgi:DNA-binding response OmpR family regulator